MAEDVRLVVWDLDETLWRGTLTEGGIEHRPEYYEIIRKLAHRGIVSSICSKNDFERVRSILIEQNIWDYFIFPNIDWTSKGPRLESLVEAVQLRPETVLFIDDNAGNRAEAQAMVPGLQTSDEGIIPDILENPLFKGKDDADLSRLKQYKLLEQKKADETDALTRGGSNIDFLRSSNIRIIIDHNVENHLDRIKELINRTNQLNFTKKRLPEDQEKADVTLKKMLNWFSTSAGVIRVVDNYGDYGICGFYQVSTWAGENRLIHFLFSCRTLGMGVEAFVYQFLGRPDLKVVGEVISDPIGHGDVDWIAIGNDDSTTSVVQAFEAPLFLRGGCDLSNVAHYAARDFKKVVGEFNLVRSGISFRTDHSIIGRLCLDEVPAKELLAFKALGYVEDDFHSESLHAPPGSVCILSFAPDHFTSLYTHKSTGVVVPFSTTKDKDRPESWTTALDTEFEYFGHRDIERSKENIGTILDRLSECLLVFVVLYSKRDERGEFKSEIDRFVTAYAGRRRNVVPLGIFDFATEESEFDGNHPGRAVYVRMYRHIFDRVSERRQQVESDGVSGDETMELVSKATSDIGAG